MVRDEKGQKMSKTKGNVIDPLDITEKYGADALRFTLAALTSAQGRDIKLAKERIEGYRAFANKLWNATRFALMNLEGAPDRARAAELARTPADRWLLARLARAVNGTVDALEAFRFDEAASTVYRFCWNDLCDWYIELVQGGALRRRRRDEGRRPGRAGPRARHGAAPAPPRACPSSPRSSGRCSASASASPAGPPRSSRPATRSAGRSTRPRSAASARCWASSRPSATSAAR